MPGITITNDVRKILTGASPAGDLLVITQQLDPGVWLQVKKVLTAAGGKWNRSRGGTEFPGKQAADVLAQLLHADRVVNEAQRDGWFATPARSSPGSWPWPTWRRG